MTKAVLTVIGSDRVGIIAKVSATLAEANANILDISQTTMQDIFTMTMLVDVTQINEEFATLAKKFETLGDEMGLRIRLCHVDIFNAMHKI